MELTAQSMRQGTTGSVIGLLLKRNLTNVRLKWVKNRCFDHIIEYQTDVKVVCLIKNAIKRSSKGCLDSNSLSILGRQFELTIPILRFMRRYPTIFKEFNDERYKALKWFRLTETARILDQREQLVYRDYEVDCVERLCRLLMMTNSRVLPLKFIEPLKWDLGLADDYLKSLIPKFPDHFRIVKHVKDFPALSLANWHDEFAVSDLHKKSDAVGDAYSTYRNFKKGVSLSFPMSFPRSYGCQKNVLSWMKSFEKLPYVSPYEDCSSINPTSDLMEKRVVGVLHELLSVMVHKMTRRNYIRFIREELNLPNTFTRIFTRYPGIFYLSLKCDTTTVALREGYLQGKLVDPHPIVEIREEYFNAMNTGIICRERELVGKNLSETSSSPDMTAEMNDEVDYASKGSIPDDDEEEPKSSP